MRITFLTTLTLCAWVQSVIAVDYWSVKNLQGVNLTQAFNWETGGGWDNGGIPLYVNQPTARRYGLWKLNSAGQNIFQVHSQANVSPYRMSTRISTKENFSGGGLFVFDVAHIPSGYGLWPAIWMVGVPDWPNMGEIDIIEGVHTTTRNTQSYHTGTNCSMQPTGFSNVFTLDNDLKYNCSAYAADNQGCSTRNNYLSSYGTPFNKAGGGYFVVQWNTTGIAMYSYARQYVPKDILAGNPTGIGWGTPTAYLANTNCNIMDNFYGMKIVINTNLCGAWAGGVWNQDLSYAGASGSPATNTRVSTCESYVLRGGYNALKEAYWSINSIKIYNSTDPGLATPAPPTGNWTIVT